MTDVKPFLETSLLVALPVMLQTVSPFFAFASGVFGTFYLFFKMHRSYFIWKNMIKKRKENDK